MESDPSQLYKELCDTLPAAGGKRIGSSTWLHSSALDGPGRTVQEALRLGAHAIPEHDLVVRVDRDTARIALLHYPDFHTLAHPALCCSTIVSATADPVTRWFRDRDNRPILHRKELLVRRHDPSYNAFRALTEAEERLGLLADSKRIGWSRYWNQQLRERGLVIEGHVIRERDTGS